jgi:hypothetical protein
MTKLLEQAIARLRKMPDAVQDLAASRLLRHVDEAPEADEMEAIVKGREAFESGDFVTLDQWRHDMEFGDR